MAEASVQETNRAIAAYAARDDLTAYGSNGLLLFALQLRFGVQDVEGIAATALTDGPNDKKCDLVYVDRGEARIVVGQGYIAADESKKEAPGNKASDLNTAVSWLLASNLATLPQSLQSAAAEVRDALAGDEIRQFEVWYAHNLPESDNVRRELGQAVRTADSLVKRYFPDSQVECSAEEIGRGELESLYRRTEAPIAVTESFELEVPGGFEVKRAKWKAFTTAVPGSWLRQVWLEHQEDLMSPNVRDYLGIVRSERNINNGIKTTASLSPEEFWIYNNGLTILVHEYEWLRGKVDGDGDEAPRDRLTIRGIGIVNGAQTTGSIGLSTTKGRQDSARPMSSHGSSCATTPRS
jgi:hypothetical protein